MMKFKRYFFLIYICVVLFGATAASAEENLVVPFYEASQVIRPGVSGQLVYSLQSFLANQGILPHGLITGYYGHITQLAVKVFQLKNGIEAVGIVGPKTKVKIKSLILSSNNSSSVKITAILPPPIIIATTTEAAPVELVATSTEYLNFKILPKPEYDLKQLAKDIQNLVNDKRQENGLSPIYWNDELSILAEDHSRSQAGDNIEITNPEKVCHYPIIRHEGLAGEGFSLQNRYESRNIHYVYGGENIAMVPASKNTYYIHLSSEPAIICLTVDKFTPGEGTEEQRTALFNSVLTQSKNAVKDLKPATWINREWYTSSELAEIIVDGWMNSPGHRENILRKEYTLGGIGIWPVNNYIIVTHDFVGL